MEMFGDDVTQFVSFDDGMVNPTVGDLKPLNPDAPQVIGPNGVFGKCLTAGGVSFGLDQAGRETFDTTVPGTVLCWVRSELVPPKAKLEPAMLFFLVQSKDVKRKLYGMKRGGAKWGWGPIEIFYEYFDQGGVGLRRSGDQGLELVGRRALPRCGRGNRELVGCDGEGREGPCHCFKLERGRSGRDFVRCRETRLVLSHGSG